MEKRKMVRTYHKRLKEPPKEPTPKDIEKIKEDAYKKIARLKKLIQKEKTGWKEFVEIIEGYIAEIQFRKLSINHAGLLTQPKEKREKTLGQLALFDEDIYILEWVIQAPKEYIRKVENAE